MLSCSQVAQFMQFLVGELLWAILTGYEAIGTVFDGERGRKVINRFSIGFAMASIAKELNFMDWRTFSVCY